MHVEEIFTVIGKDQQTGRKIAVACDQFLFNQLCSTRKLPHETQCTVDFVSELITIVYSVQVDNIIPPIDGSVVEIH